MAHPRRGAHDRGEWIDPQRSAVPFGAYADRWIRERPGLRPRTVELYRWLLAKHLEPRLGQVELGDLSTVVGPPKSRVGVRTISIPTAIRGEIVKHLMTYVDSRPEALVFTGPKGGALRRAHFDNLTKWVETVRKLGVPVAALPRPAAHRQPVRRADGKGPGSEDHASDLGLCVWSG